MLDKRAFVDEYWRVGKSVGRTIYAKVGRNDNEDVLIGTMDTPELALDAVQAHNAIIADPRRT